MREPEEDDSVTWTTLASFLSAPPTAASVKVTTVCAGETPALCRLLLWKGSDRFSMVYASMVILGGDKKKKSLLDKRTPGAWHGPLYMYKKGHVHMQA